MNNRNARHLPSDAYRVSTFRRAVMPGIGQPYSMAHGSLVWLTSQQYPRHPYINAAR
ncbi:MAG: hypothetical protein MUF00_01550 [Gemmatimonadaceae bacterium]|jgi:hypothetical protein|nr:hypothetical protein [Gemmatimonadaceae bacterium]